MVTNRPAGTARAVRPCNTYAHGTHPKKHVTYAKGACVRNGHEKRHPTAGLSTMATSRTTVRLPHPKRTMRCAVLARSAQVVKERRSYSHEISPSSAITWPTRFSRGVTRMPA